jgi:uncharacterized membrane protein YjjP (DUF1212 family)
LSIQPATHITSRAERGDAALRFLQLSARLMLEYNVRAARLTQQIVRLATHLDIDVVTLVRYRDVTLATGDGRHVHAHTSELRINVAVSLEARRIFDALCANRLSLDEATARLEAVERTAPRHARWLVVALFGLAASALAWLLLGDWGAIAATGVSSALGLVARQELDRRQVAQFALPFSAALIGAVVGGAVIHLGWTVSPGLCLIVPALMLVPGPHLINSVDDMLENHMETAASRLMLAASILLAAALGVVLGGWLTESLTASSSASSTIVPLTLAEDMALAAVAASGFGVFYNAPWRVLWISIVSGMVGHGVRFLLEQQGVGPGGATLIACLAIGVMAGVAVDRLRVPFSAVAFAGAVPMMPGVFIYESIAGALRMAAAGRSADPALAAVTLSLVFKSAVLVAAMAVGLLVGSRLGRLVAGVVLTPQRP